MMANDTIALSSLPELRRLVPDFTFKRAKEIASSHKIHNPRFEGPGLQISSATCSGSNPEDSYSLSVSINAESPSKPVCQCSCPAASKAKGNLCKHVVALLILRIEEASKLSKQHDNEVMQFESRSIENKVRESSLSDSQATEPFTHSQSPIKPSGNETSTAASSGCQATENNRKRVLPSWISRPETAKTATENGEVKRGANKQTKRSMPHGSDEAADEVPQIAKATRSNKSRGQNNTLKEHKGRAKSTISGKRRISVEEAGAVDDVDSGETVVEEDRVVKRQLRGRKERDTDTGLSVKHVPKRRKARHYVESDLSEEEPASNDNCESFEESKEDLGLTSEDLVSMARQHLEMEKGSIDKSNNKAVDNEVPAGISNTKKKGSIFSVQGWNDIATKSFDTTNDSLLRETLEVPETEVKKDKMIKHNSQASGEFSDIPLSGFAATTGKVSESLEPAENIVDDMLGLFFGPSLTKAVNAKTENTQDFSQNLASSVILPERTEPEVVLPVNTEAVPMPKKKSSLKDQVMMYLG